MAGGGIVAMLLFSDRNHFRDDKEGGRAPPPRSGTMIIDHRPMMAATVGGCDMIRDGEKKGSEGYMISDGEKEVTEGYDQ